MNSFVTSFLFVALAEMGDKTQLLAMAFAAEYKAYKVLIAVFFATLLNHALAVALGHYLSRAVPLDIVSLVAALSFILFGLWTIRGDTLDETGKRESRFGPILTVGIAFFLAELGDKTQLTTISLAAEYIHPLQVLMGTTLGMVVADSIGIFAGAILAKTISEKTIKFIAAGVFVLFGLSGVYRFAAVRMHPVFAAAIVAALCAATVLCGHSLVRRGRGTRTPAAPEPEKM